MAKELDPDALRAEVERARHLFQRGRPQQSLRRLLSLRQRIERFDRVHPGLQALLARVILTQAPAHFEVSGDLAASLELLDAAEALSDQAGNLDIAASIRGQRGLLLLRSGLVQEALVALDDAEGLLEYAPPDDQAIILLNRSALHLERGHLDLAAADAARCATIADEHGDREYYWAARHNLGYLDFLAGRLPRALAQMQEALAPELGEPHPVNLLDQARVLREAGLVRDADAILARAAAKFVSGRLSQDLAETELVRAECALVDADPKRARVLASSAQRRFLRRGNLTWQRKAELLVLRCDRRLADDKTGSARNRSLVGIATRASDLATACKGEGRSDLARVAQLLAAEAQLRAGGLAPRVPALTTTDTLETRLQTHEVRALLAIGAGDHKRAQAEVCKGFAELGSYQNRFGSLDLRTASAMHGGALAKLQLDLAMQTGRPSAVFAGIERARAVSTRLAHVRPPTDERTAGLLSELRQVEEEARALVGDTAAADALARFRTRSAHLQRDIRARAWELEPDQHGPVEASARLGLVRAAAGERAFATYARHHGRWVAVVAAGRRVELLPLAEVKYVDELVQRVRADLDAVAMPRLAAPMVQAIRGSISATLARLDRLLVEPLRVEGKSLVVSCSGSLVVMPWSLLPSRSGHATVVTPSASSWLRSQQGGRAPAPAVVAIGGPDLHLSADEAKRVGAVWTGARVVTGEEATVGATHEALQQADVVHIAAHGTHRQDSPLFSSIRLADGQLYAYELDADAHIAPFVALSACEAGLATVRPGDEGLGMTNVLLQLGTRSVLAGVARVRDDVAAEVMQRVHHGMASGADSAGALAVAQADCSDASVPVPFLCFGSSW